jgi:hypothetical protein
LRKCIDKIHFKNTCNKINNLEYILTKTFKIGGAFSLPFLLMNKSVVEIFNKKSKRLPKNTVQYAPIFYSYKERCKQ